MSTAGDLSDALAGRAADLARAREEWARWIASWLAGLSDEDVRQASLERQRTYRPQSDGKVQPLPEEIKLMSLEYDRRVRENLLVRLTPDDIAERKRQRSHERFADLELLPDEEVRDASRERSRLRRAKRRIPEDVWRKANEYARRCKDGRLVRLAPEERGARQRKHPPATHLSDEVLRSAVAEYARLQRRGVEIPAEIMRAISEYSRRRQAGQLDVLPPEERLRRRTAAVSRSANPEWARCSDEELRAASNEYAKLRCAGLPVPEDVRSKADEYGWRYKHGYLKLLTPEERREAWRRGHRSMMERNAGSRERRESLLPPREELVARRKALGLTGRELAAIIGVSQSLICHWERGGTPSEANLRRYAEVLGVKINDAA